MSEQATPDGDDDLTEEMAMLMAVAEILLQGDEHDLEARKAAARKIAGLPAVEVTSTRHARPGSVLRYLMGRDGQGPTPADARLAARVYAALYTVAAQQGVEIEEGELASSNAELSPLGWSVEEAEGGHAAAPLPAGSERFFKPGVPEMYAHAPKGGITINGVFFPGGRFLPTGDVDDDADIRLPGGQRIKGSAFKEAEERKGRGGAARRPGRLDLGSLDMVVAAAPVEANQKAAMAIWRIMHAKYGPHGPARLTEVVGLVRRVYDALRRRKAPPEQYRLIAGVAATLAEAGRLMAAAPEEGDASGLKVVVIDGGELTLVPGGPVEGFSEAAPGRWSAPDTPETRRAATASGHTPVTPAGEAA